VEWFLLQKTVVLCVGNRQGGDDAVGPFIADKLQKHEKSDLICIDAGIAPENFTDKVKNYHPERLIIIDAIEMDLKPGEIRQVPPKKIGVMHISTHGIPLSVFIKYFHQYIDSIVLIGIQPSKMSGNITDNVIFAADKLIQIIISDSIEKISKLI
jgi:hydrogenase 3 maturation protease